MHSKKIGTHSEVSADSLKNYYKKQKLSSALRGVSFCSDHLSSPYPKCCG